MWKGFENNFFYIDYDSKSFALHNTSINNATLNAFEINIDYFVFILLYRPFTPIFIFHLSSIGKMTTSSHKKYAKQKKRHLSSSSQDVPILFISTHHLSIILVSSMKKMTFVYRYKKFKRHKMTRTEQNK